MLNCFIKYHSLGNDLILFDWLQRTAQEIDAALLHPQWAERIRCLCHRHTGVGADGAIILIGTSAAMAEMLVFNADGTQAETCLNGMRCAAHYLHEETKHLHIGILSHQRRVDNVIAAAMIETHLPALVYEGDHRILVNNELLQGYRINAGNPHFVVCQEKTLSYLAEHGALIEQHPTFPHKTNVEFVWPEKNGHFHLLVYERGCGITQACSSGAAAALMALYRLEMIAEEKMIHITMPGGIVQGRVHSDGSISLFAEAHPVFQGTIASGFRASCKTACH